MKVKLEWWNPLVGCVPSQQRQEKIWIRAIGIPLHLWSKEVFKEICDKCGGWYRTEEETELRNHLRWARIEVKNEGQKIPREVAITKQGYTFRILIWMEKVTTFEKASGKNMENQISMAEMAKTGETLDEGFAQRSDTCPIKRTGNTQRLKASFEVINQVASLTAVDWMAHMGSGNNSNLNPREEHEFWKETTTIRTSSPENFNATKNLESTTTTSDAGYVGENSKKKELSLEETEGTVIVREIKGTENCKEQSIMMGNSSLEVRNWEEDEVLPLATEAAKQVVDKEKSTTVWVRKNLIKLGKMFGADFKIHEEEALELLMQIDACRHIRRMEIIRNQKN
ncbi:hypothetical protein KY289_030711 [Solanum tuberosum]|nr:hypothetical protein KY289_030711 [Solanum tuberosum]